MTKKKNIKFYFDILNNYQKHNHYNIQLSDLINGIGKNGKKENWNFMMQLLLYNHEEDNFQEAILCLIKNGGDPNILSKKGCSLFHLFIILLFYCPTFHLKKTVQFFLKLLNFNFNNETLFIYNYNNIFSCLDLLVSLQHQDKVKIKRSFFPSNLKVQFNKLGESLFETIYIALVCHNDKFFFLNKNDKFSFVELAANLPNYNTIDDLNKLKLSEKLNPHLLKFLYQYIVKKYNLTNTKEYYPENLQQLYFHLDFNTSSIYDKGIGPQNYMSMIDKPTIDSSYEVDHYHYDQPKDFTLEKNVNLLNTNTFENPTFLNPLFISNNDFSINHFIEIDSNFFFHENYCFYLINKKKNPFTNKPLNNETIDSIFTYMQKNYIFPISSLTLDDLQKSSSLFNIDYNTDDEKTRKTTLLQYIETFFSYNHPYNQIIKLQNFKKFQIKFFSYNILQNTSLFPNFRDSFLNPNISNLLKIILSYCRSSKSKYLNIIFYFLEEAMLDLDAYDKVQLYLKNINLNYHHIMDTFEFRYNQYHSSSVFFPKFLNTMLKIKQFESELKGNI